MFLTIFTPTYNRAYKIENLYLSLCRQTDNDFEWIIVDDGSTDDTETLVSSFIDKSNNFEIQYIKQENGGKHRAINVGVKLAKGKLFFIVDSDDYLSDDAVEIIKKWEHTLPYGQWAGVAGLRAHQNGSIIGGTYKSSNFVDATSAERQKYNLTGDKAEVIYTEVIKQFPFPEFENENFVTEIAMWLPVAAAGYKFRWFNEVIYYCEYLPDGLTKNIDDVKKRNPMGFLYAYRIAFHVEKSIKERLSAAYNYKKIAKSLGWDMRRIRRESEIGRFTFFVADMAKLVFGRKKKI